MLMQSTKPLDELENSREFVARHIGVSDADEAHMLSVLGQASRRALIDSIVPRSIARAQAMQLPAPVTEAVALDELKQIAKQNQLLKSFIGQGYYGTHTPNVILRNILENPAWYTAYTPYQAEISQGRMEALVNFQTMVCDLTAMPIANASMLDEATAAAEAMTLALRVGKSDSKVIFVANNVLPQTIEVIQTRAEPLGLVVKVGPSSESLQHDSFAMLLQYPGVDGEVGSYQDLIGAYKAKGGLVIMAADLLALTLLTPPGELGADIVVGNTQRFGMPMGAGGPHAAYLACQDEYKRSMPGRLVGVSIDTHGNPSYRLALQTREQHIRREKATSNICTAQVLPAVVASMYAVYHGPQGLRRIAERVATYTAVLARGLQELGCHLQHTHAFDTLVVLSGARTESIAQQARSEGINLRLIGKDQLGISLDETTTRQDINLLWKLFASTGAPLPNWSTFEPGLASLIPKNLQRTSAYLTHPVFNAHHSETGMLRYIRALSDKDLALDRSMIPLGSCTMKLNATSEMIPITWPEFAQPHPFAPADQLQGFKLLDEQLRAWLCQATGYAGISLQPNAGSQGEYAGLLVIRAYHAAKGQGHRNICLIPASAHGTNPASAQMVGMQVVVVACDTQGNVDMADMQAKCEEHSANLAAVMITYPSTHGVFETQVKALCALVHQHGGRVYVDGANMNALVGVAAPGEFGGDVSHLNLHKTFCIPHGGGGPGVGPVIARAHLAPFLPNHPLDDAAGPETGPGPVSSAPFGSASILPIPWMYIRMMGGDGLTRATQIAILSANYIAKKLDSHFPVLYKGENGFVAHECILDLREITKSTGVTADDVAKRLMDHGFHAPTMSFPVAGTLMVEPTESEDLAELDRFIQAMISIRAEIADIEKGELTVEESPLRFAPHTDVDLLRSTWDRKYSREVAAYPGGIPTEIGRSGKYWPTTGRIDGVFGDRNLVCACPPIEEFAATF